MVCDGPGRPLTFFDRLLGARTPVAGADERCRRRGGALERAALIQGASWPTRERRRLVSRNPSGTVTTASSTSGGTASRTSLPVRRIGAGPPPFAAVGLEAGPPSQWLHRGLTETGECRLDGNPSGQGRAEGVPVKTDRRETRGMPAFFISPGSARFTASRFRRRSSASRPVPGKSSSRE